MSNIWLLTGKPVEEDFNLVNCADALGKKFF